MMKSVRSNKPDAERKLARFNPFAMHLVENIQFRFPRFGSELANHWESQLKRLKQLKNRAAIVGPQGSGKTTLLLELQRVLETQKDCQVSYTFVGRSRLKRNAQFSQLLNAGRAGFFVLVDGVERFSFRRRQILKRKSRVMNGFVITQHRVGSYPVWVKCSTDWRLMQEILLELLPNPDGQLLNLAQQRFSFHRGNIRDTLRDLYDWSAGTRS